MWVLLSIPVVLLTSGLVYQWVGARRTRRQFPPPGRLIDVGGRHLHVRCTGTGAPAVVFESGIAASSVSWSIVQPRVASLTTSCSYDRAGLAWSEPGERRRSMAGFVAELRRVLDLANVPPPYVLVGHSFGGMIIRAFARAHRRDVAGLVFVDTLHPEEWLDRTVEQRRLLRGGVFLSEVGALLAQVGVVRVCLDLLTGGAPGVPRRFSRVFGGTAARLLEHVVGEVRKLPSDVLPAVQSHWSHPRAFRGMSQHLAALFVCSEQLANGTDDFDQLPIAVLSAANRSPRWLEADRVLAHKSLRGRHVVSTKAGHWLQLDDPGLVVEAVRGVVAEARSLT